MSRRIFCYGDSNTYGFDPRDPLGGRHDRNHRWTGILSESTGWDVVNVGLNGREIPHTLWQTRDFERQLTEAVAVDALVIMLGTNDLLQLDSPTAREICTRMEGLLTSALAHPVIKNNPQAGILLIAPPLITIGSSCRSSAMANASRMLGESYRLLAARYDIGFADSSAWNIDMSFDGFHFSEKGHFDFAAKVKAALENLL